MTGFAHLNPSFSFKDPNDYARLRSLLERTGYTDKGILEALRIPEFSWIKENDTPILMRQTRRPIPLNAFIRLFLMGVPTDRELLGMSIRPMELETLAEAGLIELAGNLVQASVRLLPYQNFIVAFDFPRRLHTPQGHDYVMGIGRSSLTLANLTVRKQAALALDLGTGCGIQALLAAAHSGRVLAVDRNPRAVRLAAFNAGLNGMPNIQPLEGDLLQPVAGNTFDLIVSNPPFVISPDNRYIYRDSGMAGDEISRKIVREAPRLLREGGYCQILCNWAGYSGQDWRERLTEWFRDCGCDVWVMHSETRDAATYAATWIRHTEKAEPEEFARHFEEWMTYYEEQGIGSVCAGLITMRRSSGHANWFRADDAPDKMLGPCGDDIARGFALRDFLEDTRDDAKLLSTAFRFSPAIRLERQTEPSAGGWADVETRLSLSKGLAYAGTIDPYMADLIAHCDGNRRLDDLLKEMAASLGVDDSGIESDFCSLARRLIGHGFLLPVHLSDTES